MRSDPLGAERSPVWLDQIAEGVVLVSEGRVSLVNRAAATLLQVDPENALGKPLIAVARDHRIERAYLEDETVELEARGHRLLVTPIEGGLSLRDVTALRAREDEARDLLAVLSHELRTPVTTIQSTLEALAGDLPEAQRTRFLARALQEGERLIRLLGDLTTEVSPPRARTVWIHDAIDRAESLLAVIAAERQVEIRRSGPRLAVWMDPDKLLQVLLNLIENAIVHGPSGSEIVVESRMSEARTGVVVAVRDRGEPLDAPALEHLFMLRRRGSAPASAGAGLGLYIVRSIAERSGGRAWGRSWEHGNEFAVILPRPGSDQPSSAATTP